MDVLVVLLPVREVIPEDGQLFFHLGLQCVCSVGDVRNCLLDGVDFGHGRSVGYGRSIGLWL